MYTDTYAEEEVDQYETYEVVESSPALVTPRRWRDLSGRILPVSADYARTLESDNIRLKEENQRLKEALARSGNRYLLADANDWMTRVRKLEMANSNLRGKVAELEAQLRIQENELTAEHRMEMLEVTNRADYYERMYRDLVEANARTVNGSRDRGSGQFKREDGLSGDEVRRKALEMYDKHVPFAEIGRKLGVSAETAKKYIREGYQSRGHQKAVEAFEAKKQKLAM
jgi:hypothetical protein